jgi:hypothetical protein
VVFFAGADFSFPARRLWVIVCGGKLSITNLEKLIWRYNHIIITMALTTLPSEMIREIISHLPIIDYKNIKHTCSFLYKCIEDAERDSIHQSVLHNKPMTTLDSVHSGYRFLIINNSDIYKIINYKYRDDNISLYLINSKVISILSIYGGCVTYYSPSKKLELKSAELILKSSFIHKIRGI